VPFVAQAWLALMQDGQWSKRSVLVSGDLECVFAVDGRRVVGCLTYHVDENVGAVINITYVPPAFRVKGVYPGVHEAFAAKAKASGANGEINICYTSNNDSAVIKNERINLHPGEAAREWSF